MSGKKLSFPKAWYPLAGSSALKRGKLLRQTAFGVPLVLYRSQQGRVGVMTSTCVHMGADLSRGKVSGERLQCPMHGWEFNTGGRCEHIPMASEIPNRARQSALCIEERNGIVFGFLGGEPDAPPPDFPAEAFHQTSRITVMDFDTPYQVLASNSYDAQHFSTVHHRPLVGTPKVFINSPHHYGLNFRASVGGDGYNDRLLRAIGVREVELVADCYGGNIIVATSDRTSTYIMFATLPVTETSSRIFVLNAITKARARKIPALLRPVLMEITHRLTLAFLRHDIAIVNGLQFKFGILLPEVDSGFMGWMRYWNSLPTATLADSSPQADSPPSLTGLHAAD
ncbi:MAG: Rieske 2Fe-2S domain-containing protein [Anaerolineales bacterium]|jgi:phenylpropionate dioxygenase-like ring-hydroxylating dioxygenase large terminal subunit|nr:Rieske 2Fe-2S domain-containing protein [Chloroflexota bacterium]MBK6645160.1 Rieske 2Fe-2S domain-containing protein [Anaerolineales bacterium]MCC6985845.1 Rieske 2Fe-2S domain-containing protein [Anaerolineales bacterium]